VESERGRFESFVAGIGTRPRTLHLLDVESPHYPWNHLYNGQQYSNLTSEFGPFFGAEGEWRATRAVTDLALQRHLLAVGFVDRLLGELIARMRRLGIWERALMVVAADHGGAFIPGVPRRNPSRANLGQVASVPMLIKAPGQRRGRVTDEPFCTTDLVPEIARLLGVRYPWSRDRCPRGSVTVDNSPEGEATAPRSTVERQRDAYVERIRGLFGAGTGWGPVLRFGPHPELVGRRVGGLATAATSGAGARLDDPAALRSVNPRAAYVPAALLRGSISGAGPGAPLAVAVNGTVVAVGKSFDQSGETRFSIVVHPRYFGAGANRVALYRVVGSGVAVRLERLDGP
jgi:Sulfatase